MVNLSVCAVLAAARWQQPHQPKVVLCNGLGATRTSHRATMTPQHGAWRVGRRCCACARVLIMLPCVARASSSCPARGLGRHEHAHSPHLTRLHRLCRYSRVRLSLYAFLLPRERALSGLATWSPHHAHRQWSRKPAFTQLNRPMEPSSGPRRHRLINLFTRVN